MKYIVFLTENTKCNINGSNRIYIGVHGTENPDDFDGYLGDSIYVNQASSFMYAKSPLQGDVKKFGTDSFRRMTLYVYDDYKSAYRKEQELVNMDFIEQSHTYNTYISDEFEFRTNTLYQFDTLGNLKKEWKIPADAADIYGYPITRFFNASKEKESFLDSFWANKPRINVREYKILKTHNCITYLYSENGKLLKEYWNIRSLINALGWGNSFEDVLEAIKNHHEINGYYVLNYMTPLFSPSPRKQYIRETFHVYTQEGNYLGAFKGKDVMKVIDLHSWAKISKIFEFNKNWYKNWYISLEPVDKLPERKFNTLKIDVYDKYGNFIEHLDSPAVAREKYGIPSSKMKNIQQGNKYFGDHIFKYSK